MRLFRVSLAALGFVLSVVGTGKADPTFIDARLTLRVEARVIPDNLQWQVVDKHATGSYTDQAGSANISSSTSNGTAVAFSSADTTWDSNANGRVSFYNVGFVQAILQESGLADVDNSSWSYTFTTETEDQFQVTYATGISDSTEDIVGIQGFTVVVIQNGERLYAEDLDLGNAGSVSFPLEPYQTYTAVIIPNGGFKDESGLGISSMWGDFFWAVGDQGSPSLPPIDAGQVLPPPQPLTQVGDAVPHN